VLKIIGTPEEDFIDIALFPAFQPCSSAPHKVFCHAPAVIWLGASSVDGK